MPPFAAKLVNVMIGLPGALLWIAGGICTVSLGFSCFLKEAVPTFRELAPLGIAIAAATVGYLMVATSTILAGGARYRIAGEHLPRLIALEIGVQASATLSFCAGIGWFGRLGSGDRATVLTCFLEAFLAFWGATWLFQCLEDSVEKWEEEFSHIHDPLQPEAD